MLAAAQRNGNLSWALTEWPRVSNAVRPSPASLAQVILPCCSAGGLIIMLLVVAYFVPLPC